MDAVDFRRGYAAGYQARVQEEVREYFKALTAGREIYDRVIKGLVELPTAAERERARLLIVREGHDAGIHEGGRRGCPWCDELAAPARVVAVHFAVDRAGCPNESSTTCCAELGYCSMLRRNAASDRHHSGDYVVPARRGCEFHRERGDGYVVNCPACEAVLAGRRDA